MAFENMALRSNVIGAAISGLTALVLSASQVARSESICLRYLRVLLGGVATRIEVVNPDGSKTTVIRTPLHMFYGARRDLFRLA
eukprot:2348886-Pyramimonas_sp.AAC.1